MLYPTRSQHAAGGRCKGKAGLVSYKQGVVVKILATPLARKVESTSSDQKMLSRHALLAVATGAAVLVGCCRGQGGYIVPPLLCSVSSAGLVLSLISVLL